MLRTIVHHCSRHVVQRLAAALEGKLLHDQRRDILVGPLVVGGLDPNLIYLAIDYVRDLTGWLWAAYSSRAARIVHRFDVGAAGAYPRHDGQHWFLPRLLGYAQLAIGDIGPCPTRNCQWDFRRPYYLDSRFRTDVERNVSQDECVLHLHVGGLLRQRDAVSSIRLWNLCRSFGSILQRRLSIAVLRPDIPTESGSSHHIHRRSCGKA